MKLNPKELARKEAAITKLTPVMERSAAHIAAAPFADPAVTVDDLVQEGVLAILRPNSRILDLDRIISRMNQAALGEHNQLWRIDLDDRIQQQFLEQQFPQRLMDDPTYMEEFTNAVADFIRFHQNTNLVKIFQLFFIDGFNEDEISQIIGIKYKYIKQALEVIIKEFKTYIENRGLGATRYIES